MDYIKQVECPARLVCLEMSDEMPSHSVPAHLRDLLLSLLNAVLPKLPRAKLDQSLNQTCRMCLGDRDERDVPGTPAIAPRGCGNTGLNVRKSGGKTVRGVNVC